MLPRRLSSTLERPVPSPGREQFQAQTARAFTEVGRLAQHPGTRIGAGVLAFALVTAVTYPIARYRMFTGYRNYDDDGYMLMFLKSFLDHGWQYDRSNGYGPFYYEFWGAVYSIFGLPVNHNSSRTVVTVVWVLSSLAIGLVTWRITRSIILGVATQLSVFAALFSLVAEPMHPIGLIVLLLIAIMAASCFVRDNTARLPMALLGGSATALILIKINIGVFALAAVALACGVIYPTVGRNRWLRPIIEAGFVALPVLLMRARLDDSVARGYALHVCAAALAVVIALRIPRVRHRDPKELWWLIGGIATVGVTAPLIILAAGTDLSNLFQGAVKFPLSFGNFIFLLGWLPKWSYALDLIAVTSAFVCWYFTRRFHGQPSATWTWIVAASSIAVGLFLAFPMIWSFSLSTDITTQYPALLTRWNLFAFAWVALIPRPGPPDRSTQFSRLLIPPLAVLQTLHAFPTAGGQRWWATFLLVPVGALCVANGARWLSFGLGTGNTSPRPLAFRAIGPAMVLAVLISNVGVQLQHDLNQAREEYRTDVTLNLPGAEEIHVPAQQAAKLRAVVTALNTNCKSFIMLPGYNSFYFWTHKNPPTGYLPAKIPLLVDVSRQKEMVKSIESLDGLCLLKHPGNSQWWRNIERAPSSPLLQYLNRQNFRPLGDFGEYKLFKREPGRP